MLVEILASSAEVCRWAGSACRTHQNATATPVPDYLIAEPLHVIAKH